MPDSVLTQKVSPPKSNLPRTFPDREAMKVGQPTKQLVMPAASLPTPTLPIDWAKSLNFPSDGNDLYGDCMLAAAEHADNTFTGNVGAESAFFDPETVKEYLALSPDNKGLNTGQIVSKWMTGLPGVPEAKIQEALGIDTTNPQIVQTAIWLFGGVHFSLKLPDVWDPDPFTSGVTWDAPVTPDTNKGHAVWWNGVTKEGNYHLETWGGEAWITPAGVKECDPSGFVVFSLRWFDAQGKAPNGYHYNQLASFWTQMGGRPLPVWPDSPTQVGHLLPGQGLKVNQSIQSADGRFRLLMQGDGNLVLLGPGNQPLWASGTSNHYDIWAAIMQTDGNLVLYDGQNQPLWASHTNGKPGCSLTLQNDGNLVIYDTGNHAAWASNTVQRIQPAKPTQPGRLLPGQGLLVNQPIKSADGRFSLELQGDGNLVLSGPDHQPMWASHTNGHTNVWDLEMQPDGNLVVYDGNRNPLWASGTNGKNGASLTIQNDGNMVLYDTANHAIWATNTKAPATPLNPTQIGRLLPGQGIMAGHSISSNSRRFNLVMQSDGNLVLTGPGNTALWASGTQGHTNIWYVIMQTDGNLVIYDVNNNPLWASHTNGKNGSSLTLQDDGNLVIYDPGNHAVWSSGTKAPPTPPGPSHGDQLLPGQGLTPGMSLKCASSGDTFTMQADGNLVLYDKYNQPKWASHTNGHQDVWDVIMQTDGNLVIYNVHNQPIWASKTNGKNGASLIVQDDGNVVIYAPGHNPVWATGTNRHS